MHERVSIFRFYSTVVLRYTLQTNPGPKYKSPPSCWLSINLSLSPELFGFLWGFIWKPRAKAKVSWQNSTARSFSLPCVSQLGQSEAEKLGAGPPHRGKLHWVGTHSQSSFLYLIIYSSVAQWADIDAVRGEKRGVGGCPLMPYRCLTCCGSFLTVWQKRKSKHTHIKPKVQERKNKDGI